MQSQTALPPLTLDEQFQQFAAKLAAQKKAIAVAKENGEKIKKKLQDAKENLQHICDDFSKLSARASEHDRKAPPLPAKVAQTIIKKSEAKMPSFSAPGPVTPAVKSANSTVAIQWLKSATSPGTIQGLKPVTSTGAIQNGLPPIPSEIMKTNPSALRQNKELIEKKPSNTAVAVAKSHSAYGRKGLTSHRAFSKPLSSHATTSARREPITAPLKLTPSRM